MKNRNIYIFLGTTAEFIKLAPVIKELKKRRINFRLITSGQTQIHFEDFISYLGKLQPYYSLKDKANKSSIFHFFVWAVKTFFQFLMFLKHDLPSKDKKCAYILVHGDTVSALIGALVARIIGIKVAHIESGLRSFNFFEPFPEEICRFIISKISDFHFCPNNWAVKNLKGEKGVKINTNQNTFIESFIWALKLHTENNLKIKGRYFVLVVHRQEHVIFSKQKTVRILKHVFNSIPKNVTCVFLIHELTKSLLSSGLKENILERLGVKFVPRQTFTNFVNLLEKAEFIITDGGTNQEEAYYLGKPCLILRNVTERIEGLNENAIISSDNKSIIQQFIKNYKIHKRQPVSLESSPSKLVVDYLLSI